MSKYKNLIALVRDHPELYNTLDEKFRNQEIKDAAWNEISSKLSLSENKCKCIWIRLKYDYQEFARKLNNWMKKKHKRIRPKMAYERDMIFLWKFIPKRKCLKKKKENHPLLDLEFKNVTTISDESIEDHQEINNVCDETFANKVDLIESIKCYPEIYDSKNLYHNDPTRRGIIWSSIANETKFNVFQCIQRWFELKVTFEYYLTDLSSNQKSDLTKSSHNYSKYLEFYRSFVNIDEIKNSKGYWLRHYTSKVNYTKIDIMVLLKLIKGYPQLYGRNTEYLSDRAYKILWQTIASKLNTSATNCEQLWIILKLTYKEICFVNSGENKFTGKWNLEDYMKEFEISKDNSVNEIFVTLDTSSASTSTKLHHLMSTDQIREFIQAVKHFPDLYRAKNHNPHVLNDMWSRIASKFGVAVFECRELWRNLVYTFEVYESNRTKKAKLSKTFKYYKDMLFIKEATSSAEAKKDNNMFPKKNVTVTKVSKPIVKYSKESPNEAQTIVSLDPDSSSAKKSSSVTTSCSETSSSLMESSTKTSNSFEIIDITSDNENEEINGLNLNAILLLIQTIKNSRVLYDYTCLDYHVKEINEKEWEKVSAVTSIKANKCKGIWDLLRMKYWKYIKIDEERKTLLSTQIRNVFESMNFLLQLRNEY